MDRTELVHRVRPSCSQQPSGPNTGNPTPSQQWQLSREHSSWSHGQFRYKPEARKLISSPLSSNRAAPACDPHTVPDFGFFHCKIRFYLIRYRNLAEICYVCCVLYIYACVLLCVCICVRRQIWTCMWRSQFDARDLSQPLSNSFFKV